MHSQALTLIGLGSIAAWVIFLSMAREGRLGQWSRESQAWASVICFGIFAVTMLALRLYLEAMSADFVWGAAFGICAACAALGLAFKRVRNLD